MTDDMTMTEFTGLGTNVLDEANAMFSGAIERAAKLHGNEPIRWGLTLHPLPTQQRDAQTGQQQLVVVLVLYLSIRGAQVGTAISSTSLIEIDGRTQDITDQQVYELIEGAINARSRQLDQQAIDAELAAQNGSRPPTSGLIARDGSPLRANADDVDQRATQAYLDGSEPPTD